MLDLGLAAGHHLLIFALFGVLVAELVILRNGVGQSAVTRLGAIDIWYGALAGLIIVGFTAKIGAFALIDPLSAPPTLAYIRWRRARITPSDAQVRAARRYLLIEIALFPLLPIFAAAMARGYGEIG